MHSRSAQNFVLFNQHRENGINCKWTGLKKMIIHELVTVCSSRKDVNTFREGFELFFREDNMYCSEDLASYLLQIASPKPSLDAVNDEKFQLLFELYKKHWLKLFTTLPTVSEFIDEILNICEKDYDVNEVAKNILLEIATFHEIYNETDDDYRAVISYLTERRGVDVNALEESDFSSLLECLKNILLRLCSAFSTLTTNVFLNTKLTARKIHLIWASVLKNLAANLIPGSVDWIRLFIRRGFDVKNALFSVDFSNVSFCHGSLQKSFKYLLEILNIFMDHGARLNPLPGSNEQPFLHGVIEVHKEFFGEMTTCPKLYGFITKCIKRGVDPKSSHTIDRTHRDLLSEVCALYDADDKNKLIEYLCNCGADASLFRNNGLDVWLRLSCRSSFELARPRSNETVLLLLRKGLRTGCIDQYGNNVLHMFFQQYAFKISISERCCLLRWFRLLDDVKFWDALDALLDAGVSVSHVNTDRLIPYQLFKGIMPRSNEGGLMQSLCSECCQKYLVEPLSSAYGICSRDVASIDVAPSLEAAPILKTTLSTAVDLKAQLTRVREFMNRLSPFSLHQT